VLILVMLASLLMAAAVPTAFGRNAELFAGSYVVLQVGRNIAGAMLLEPSDPLRAIFERLVASSTFSSGFWLGGALLGADARRWLWGAALTVELAAPFVG
jgi:low temperature requirement protein LtrA